MEANTGQDDVTENTVTAQVQLHFLAEVRGNGFSQSNCQPENSKKIIKTKDSHITDQSPATSSRKYFPTLQGWHASTGPTTGVRCLDLKTFKMINRTHTKYTENIQLLNIRARGGLKKKKKGAYYRGENRPETSKCIT